MEQNNATQPLVEHWSYSSMMLLARNPLIWKKEYVLKIWAKTSNPSAIIGTAAHKFCEAWLKGSSIEEATAVGMAYINGMSDVAIEYGKTGSREGILKSYATAVKFYTQEAPDWSKRNILEVESSITEVIKDRDGNELAIPAKAKSDVIWETTRTEKFEMGDGTVVSFPKGTLLIEDHKFSSAAGKDDDDGGRIIQALFNFHVVEARYGRQPAAILFRDTKWTLNSKENAGKPQCGYYIFQFGSAQDFELFYQLYNDATRFATQEAPIFLPNFQDHFDGKDALLMYRQGLITADAPVVAKKTKMVKFEEKKFVPAAIDRVENRNLTDEERIVSKLMEFGIPVETHETHKGSSIIMYTLKPSRGVRMSAIEAHAKDLAMALKAKTIRIQAPIMGTDLVGIEVPNPHRDVVPFLVGGIPDPQLLSMNSLNIPIGVNVYGDAVISDLRTMPHLLVAGSTGSGKSVFLNVALHALTSQNTPKEMQLMLFDPKKVELSMFAEMPHLISDVITETDEAKAGLQWLNEEMDKRYTKLQKAKVREIEAYNSSHAKKIPYIVAVIDEFADLVLGSQWAARTEKAQKSVQMAAKRAKATVEAREAAKRGKTHKVDLEGVEGLTTTEELIVRLAQKARAVGIHLIIATQRPTVDVVTGLIKANMPTRIAFATASGTDSKVILDQHGAEELTRKGDMLFLDPSERELKRLQGFYA